MSAFRACSRAIRDEVTRLPMTPGTLLIFAGRHSLHRVSPIAGATERLVALLGYDTRPDTRSTPHLQRKALRQSARLALEFLEHFRFVACVGDPLLQRRQREHRFGICLRQRTAALPA